MSMSGCFTVYVLFVMCVSWCNACLVMCFVSYCVSCVSWHVVCVCMHVACEGMLVPVCPEGRARLGGANTEQSRALR